MSSPSKKTILPLLPPSPDEQLLAAQLPTTVPALAPGQLPLAASGQQLPLASAPSELASNGLCLLSSATAANDSAPPAPPAAAAQPAQPHGAPPPAADESPHRRAPRHAYGPPEADFSATANCVRQHVQAEFPRPIFFWPAVLAPGELPSDGRLEDEPPRADPLRRHHRELPGQPEIAGGREGVHMCYRSAVRARRRLTHVQSE
mmetsp:Transcript_11248/g.17027  ORF Transcript_11248/g.17027 Transcript_11248/m.17027 type:complete len:204 (+) Transcript_11248:26-637(+)